MKLGWLVVVMILGCGKKQDAPSVGSAAPPGAPAPSPAAGACSAVAPSTQLAQGKLHLEAADDTGAYITEDIAQGDHNIVRLSRVDAKGTATPLATDPVSIVAVRPIGDFLYYRAMAELKRVAKAGGDASQVKITGAFGNVIGADASQLYMVTRDKGVAHAPLAGGAAEPLFKPDAAAFDGKRFIAVHDDKVDVIAPDGTVTTLATIPQGTFLEMPFASDGSYIYYATKEPGDKHTGIQRVAVTGGEPQTIAPGEDAATLDVAGGFVYWSLRRTTTEVHRAPVAGGPVVTVACLRKRGAIDMVATAAGVYFTDASEDGKATVLGFAAGR